MWTWASISYRRLGDGSIVFIDLESGKVRGYNNDYADFEEIAESFSELILDLVEQVESYSWYKSCYNWYKFNLNCS